MTDKQIIIDDLDTRCPYHCNEKIGQCNNPSQETPHTYCIGNKDCIYKQYTRKEQECEELKKQLESTKGLVNVGNRQLAEALLELQKYEDNEQQEKEMQKLYNKFEGSSLIDYKNKRGGK